MWKDHISKEDAAVISKLKKSGAVILGKTNLHEFASGATTDSPLFGASHNPWDPERFCCGSSGGSAASIANGTALGALGTDTGGSVRLPSSVCGVVGMRPTYGKVSIKGIAPLSYSLDACGPITRNIMDNAVMLNVLAGRESSDPSSGRGDAADHTKRLGQDLRKLRVGILPDVLFKSDQPDVEAAVKKAMDAFCSLGAEIVECHIENLELMVKAWYTVDVIESSAWHQRHTREQLKDFGRDVRAMLLAGEMLSGVDYVQAQRYRRWLRQEFDKQFEKVDFFLFPTLPTTAVKIGDYTIDVNGERVDILPLTCTYVCFAPAAGLPALQLPCGRDRDGMPVGMMLLGSAFHEDILYQAGYAFEQMYSLYKELPGLN
ncbi:MAG TPA: amidase [Candidatus Blautia faecigallinarum]|uniref:Amidase n=1 Tax=Candidatus Blautia faecigallinarum TaxID=2838488 RepID=A0A9D2ITJ1_9FIRM|nr:amidase [Candidatus Blautia faecigallinarum]